MNSNVVTFDYENGNFSPATKATLGLCKIGALKLSDNYLPIFRDKDDSEVGGFYYVTGAKPLVNFVSWLTDYAIRRKHKGNEWEVDISPDGHMKATKV